MSPSTPSESPANKWRTERARMLMFLAVLVGPNLLVYGFRDTVMEWLGFQHGGLGEEMMWLYITRDFAKGLCAAGAMVFAMGAAVAARRWWPDYAAMLFWLPVIWYGGDIARGWIIYQACPGLLDGRRSTRRWPTVESYMNDAAIDWAQTIVLCAPIVLLALSLTLPLNDLWRRHWRKRARKAA